MLWSLSFHFPPRFFPLPSHKTFANTSLPLSFLHLLHTVYLFFHLCLGSNLAVYHLTILSASSLQKHISPLALIKQMYSLQGNLTVGEVTFFPLSCLKHEKLWCDNHIENISLEIAKPDRFIFSGNDTFNFLFLFTWFRNNVSLVNTVPVCIYSVYTTIYKVTMSHTNQTKTFKYWSLKKHVDTTNIFCLCLCADYFCL